MKKRVLALILAAVMTVSLAACGSQGGGTGQGNGEQAGGEKTEQGGTGQPGINQTGSGQAGSDSDSGGSEDPNGAYEDTVTLKVALMNYPGTGYAQGDDVTNNPWIRSYKERFNIDVVPAFVSDNGEYATKINLAIAEGSLPDVFQVTASQLQQLIEADLLCDLTDLFDTYAGEAIKSFMESEPESFDSGKADGRLYGIPQLGYGYLPHPRFIWIRKDWKEALKLEDPETMDDVVEIAKAFMKEYGAMGIAADQSLTMLKIIAIAWGAHPDIWVDDGTGQIVYGSVQPQMKEALAAWAGWYQEGIIGPDFATTNTEKINEDTINGKVGIYPWFQWWGYTPGADVVANLGAEAYFEPYAIPSANGSEVLSTLLCDNSTYIVVSKKCKNPEAALKCINFYTYLTDEARGIEGQELIEAHTSNGMTQAANILRVLNPNAEYNDYVKVKEALDKKDPSILISTGQLGKYNSCVDFAENGTPAAVGDYLQQGAEKSAYSIAKPILDEERYVKNKVWAVIPETLLNTGSTLEDILCEGYTKIIMGEESIDYFDTVVANWKAAGGDQATVEVNQMYGGK